MTKESTQSADDGTDDLQSLKAFLEANTDIEAALNHRFEYYLWFRGHDFRYSHWRHEEIMAQIGRFIFDHSVGECGDQDPLYVFREYELWLDLRVVSKSDDDEQKRRFRMKSYSLNLEEDVEFVRTRSAGTTSAQQD